MKTKFSWILTLLLAFFVQFSFAQEKTVSGVVTEGGQPLPSVTIIIKGTTIGTQTDLSGKYSIQAKPGDVLDFTYIGLVTKSITVGASNTVNVVLVADVEVLGDVVVEGYRTRSKTTSNIASTTITAKTIENRPNASFVQTLQAQIPGMNITTGSGQPGAASTILIRGTGSLGGSVEPLFVIDDIPSSTNNFRSINPNDIESVTVLKDAAATAIYGNRGTNGVILVKTKRGGFNQKLEVSVSSITGFTNLQRPKYNLANSAQQLTLEKRQNTGLGATLTDAEIASFPINTDWVNYFFDTGLTFDQQVSFTSGSKNTTQFTSISYSNQEGILIGSDLNRFTLRSNVSGKSDNNRFTYDSSVGVSFSRSNEPNNLGTGAVNRNYVLGATLSVPYLDPNSYVDGATLVAAGLTLLNTPLWLIDKLNTFENRTDEVKILASFTARYKLTDYLSVNSTTSSEYNQIQGLQSEFPNSFNALVFQNPGQQFVGFEDRNTRNDFSFQQTTSLIFNKDFKKHDFEVGLYTEYVKNHLETFGFRQRGLNPATFSPGGGRGYVPFDPNNQFYVPTVTANKIDNGLFSYFSRADYSYDNRFGVTGVVRRDASSRFSETNRWGTFYSVGARWNISNEAFMKDGIFDALKLRLSHGTTGNSRIQAGSIYAGSELQFDRYVSGAAYAGSVGLAPVLGNSDLSWETTIQNNIGLDFAVFNSRLTGTLDLYERTTEDLYLGAPISWATGQSQLDTNAGSMKNSGVELLLSYDLFKTNDFRFTFNFNGSYNKNELVDLRQDDGEIYGGGNTTLREGDSFGQFFLVPYAGVNPATGNLLFYNQAGDLTENPNPETDRRYTGKNSIPTYQGGFGIDVEYKGFFFRSDFSFVQDIYRFDFDLSGFEDAASIGLFRSSTDLLNAWTPENQITDVPSLGATNIGLDSSSDRYLKDASYVRLRLLSIGYNFPAKLLERSPFKTARVFANGENLITWSRWQGFDAESPRGGDQAQYPTPSIVSFGVELKF